MRRLLLPAALLILSVAIDTPSNAASPHVCRGHDEGFEVYTDCYGMTLTGATLRNAQIRELEQNGRSPSEIASMLGVQIVTVPADQTACPPGSVRLTSRYSSHESGNALIYCAY